MSLNVPRRTYADLYGPTTGDRVRLADTKFVIEVEHDFTTCGDEVTFGGGKVIRDGRGSRAAPRARASTQRSTPSSPTPSSSTTGASSRATSACAAAAQAPARTLHPFSSEPEGEDGRMP